MTKTYLSNGSINSAGLTWWKLTALSHNHSTLSEKVNILKQVQLSSGKYSILLFERQMKYASCQDFMTYDWIYESRVWFMKGSVTHMAK